MDWQIARKSLVIALWVAAQLAWAQTSADEEQRLSEQARAALQSGRYADAESAYERLKQLEPNVAEIHAALGAILFQEGKFDQATSELRHAQRLKSGLPKVDSLLAMALSEQGQFQQALPGLEKGFRQTSDPELRRMCGLRLERAYVSIHNDSKAIETALELQRSYPENAEVLYYSSKIFGNEAYLAAQKLFQTSPQSTWGLLASGEAHESQGDIDWAIRAYREVLKLSPTKANIHFRIGRALLARGESKGDPKDFEDAMNEFQQELEIDSTNANAAYELAESYRKQGRADQALKYFQQAVDSYPSFEEAHVGLAVMLLQTDPTLALTHLKSAVILNPQDPVAWYRLAQAERTLGHTEEQKQALARFQQLRNVGGGSATENSNREVTPQVLDPGEQP
jgi:tetratricopeptide (TPR) repeat protein